jgi:hypothetical protein
MKRRKRDYEYGRKVDLTPQTAVRNLEKFEDIQLRSGWI